MKLLIIRHYQKEKSLNRGNIFIITIYSILILTIISCSLIISNGITSKKRFPFESVSRIGYRNWIYKVQLGDLSCVSYYTNLGFNTYGMSVNSKYINVNDSNNSFLYNVYYEKDNQGNIIFKERVMNNV